MRFRFLHSAINLSRNQQFALLLASLAAFSTWFYLQHVLIVHQQNDAAIHGTPRGNLSDLYPRWLGARELLLRHRDPYGSDITREIQIGYYGRALDPGRPYDPKDQQAFAYPVYVIFLLSPTIHLPFHTVQAWAQPLFLILISATVLLWLRVIQWRPPLSTIAILLLLTLSSFPALQGFKLQQLSVVVSAMLAGCIVLVVSGHLLPAGILLAIATIKPQLALPLAGWLALWSFSDWRRRWRLLVGFFAAMTILIAGAQWVLPGWLSRFRAAVAAYRDYTGGGRSLLDVLLSPAIGRVLTLSLSLVILFVCWKMRSQAEQTSNFALTTALVIAATVVVIPTFALYNQLLLLPGIFLIIRSRDSVRSKNWALRLAWFGAGLTVAWPWIAASALGLASLVLPSELIDRAWTLPLYTSLAIPVAVCGLLIPLALDAARGLSSR